MKQRDSIQLKRNILESISKEAYQDDIGIEDSDISIATSIRSKNSLGVGISNSGKNDYKIVLRPYKGSAKKNAHKLASEFGSDASLSEVTKVSIPSSRYRTKYKENAKLASKVRPIHIGASIGSSNSAVSTLGGFVENKHGEIKAIGSSMSFGMFVNLGDNVYQPGKIDSPLSARNRIGTIYDSIENSRAYRNKLDCLLISIDSRESILGNLIPSTFRSNFKFKKLSHRNSNSLEWLNRKVGKIGRTSGYTEGIVSAVLIDNMLISTSFGNMVFDNVFEIRSKERNGSFSNPGDSGSPIFMKETGELIGFVFASGRVGDENITYGFPAKDIYEAFNVKLL